VLNLLDDLLGHAEIFEALPRPPVRCQATCVPEAKIGDVLRRRARQCRTVHPHQRFAFADLAAGCDVFQLVEKSVKSKRHDRLPVLVGLYDSGRTNRGGHDAAGHGL